MALVPGQSQLTGRFSSLDVATPSTSWFIFQRHSFEMNETLQNCYGNLCLGTEKELVQVVQVASCF